MIWNLGSINADNFYLLPHLPGPGETISALNFRQGLGGKGANMSVAAARAGTRVMHVGALGADGGWALPRWSNVVLPGYWRCGATPPRFFGRMAAITPPPSIRTPSSTASS